MTRRRRKFAVATMIQNRLIWRPVDSAAAGTAGSTRPTAPAVRAKGSTVGS
jgi:hypothetical protein